MTSRPLSSCTLYIVGSWDRKVPETELLAVTISRSQLELQNIFSLSVQCSQRMKL